MIPSYKTIDQKSSEWFIGKKCLEIKQQGSWKNYEIFKIKRGKNKGEFEKEPKFNKWLKHEFKDDWKIVRSLMLKYEKIINEIKFFEDILEEG